MKSPNILKIAIILFFFLSGVSMAGQWKNESGKGSHQKYDTQHGNRDQQKSHDGKKQERYDDRGGDRNHQSGQIGRAHV